MPLLLLAIHVLAIAGAVALVLRFGQSLLRLALAAANATAEAGLAETSARRGDLTAMHERRAAEKSARRSGVRELVWALGCLVALLLPLLFGVASEVYAASAVLWLFPRPPLRRTPLPPS
jgi:hypothetical protein